MTKMMFYLEESFWCFIDTVERVSGRSMCLTFKSFLKCWMDLNGFTIPILYEDLDGLISDFEKYKRTVPISCAFVTCLDPETGEQQVLLVKSATSKKKKWMLPGGKRKIYENENPHAAMVRELMEETGLDVSNVFFKQSTVVSFQRRMTIFFLDAIEKREIDLPNTKEIKEAKWFSIDDLMEKKIKRLSDILVQLGPKIKADYSIFRDQVQEKNDNNRHHGPLTRISMIKM